MDNTIFETLGLLGLSDKELRFMKSLYSLNEGGVKQIATKARIQRSTAYLISEKLEVSGFIKKIEIGNKHLLTPIDPKGIMVKLSAKQRTVRRKEIEFESKLKNLQQDFQKTSVKPNVTSIQGKDALNRIWQDVLSTKNEILVWTNQKTESKFFNRKLHDEFIAQRVEKKIPIRVLAVNNMPGRKLLSLDKSTFRESRLLPIQTSFSAETYIYDSKIAILDYKKDIIGVIIESEPISSTQRSIFEMTWNYLI